jgi:hypothetical protein
MRLRAARRVASIRSAAVRSSRSAIGPTIPPYRPVVSKLNSRLGAGIGYGLCRDRGTNRRSFLNELQEVIERPDETDHVLRLGLHRLAITEFPLLRALAPALASYDGAAELDRGLDLLLPGLTATLTHPES